MEKSKKNLILFLLFFFIIVNLVTESYAASVEVTDENLNSYLQKFSYSSDNDKNFQITVENNQIKIICDEGNYVLNYDLTNKPTFTYETEVKQGMSYSDYREKTEGSFLTMLGYIAVAGVQGVDFEDSMGYFTTYFLSIAFSSLSSSDTNNSYVIVDDINVSEGVTIEKDSTNTKTIYASDFGNHVMEYVNSIYKEKSTLKDSDGLNTFEMTSEKKDITSTSCKLLTTLTVDTDADFSQMKDYVEKKAENVLNDISNNIKVNEFISESQDSNSVNNTNKVTNNENKVANISVMPKAGEVKNPFLIILYIIISISIIGIFTLIVTSKKA